MEKLLELRRKKTELVEKLRTMLDKVEGEKRDLTEEEQENYDSVSTEIEGIKKSEEREIAVYGLEEEIGKGRMTEAESVPNDGEKETRNKSFYNWIRHGAAGITSVESRSLVEDTTGLYLVPEDLETEILRAIPELVVMRSLATVRGTIRDKIRIRSLTELSVGWGKLETGSDITESTPVPSRDWIYVEDLYGLTKVGEDELMDTDANLQAILADSFSRAIAEAEDTAFAIGTGHGNLQPDGVAVDANISKINLDTADVISVEDLIELVYNVPAKYRKAGAFLMHSKCEMAIRSLRAEVAEGYYGDFLWQPSVQEGRPNRLLGYPVYNQDDLNYPADATAANVVLFGNFKAGYRVLDRAGITLQRLDELYAEAGLVGFKVHFRVGGGVVRTNALRALYNNT